MIIFAFVLLCFEVGHLTEAHLAFFSRWDRTIDLEAKIGEQARY